ncbi:hypothetical protein [Spiroplasma ixodetis]|uniref:Transposase n=1 Tax=Spiroplasma ixodetis TaxID=2141 RepID=A0ABM8JNI2_9MOLU
MIQQHNNPQRSKLLNPHKIPSTNVYQKTVLKKVAIPEFYKYDWSEKGKRLFDNKPAYKIKRMIIIGSLNKGKLKALWAFEGHCNSKIFESYVNNRHIP